MNNDKVATCNDSHISLQDDPDPQLLGMLRKRFLQGLMAWSGHETAFHLYEGKTTTSIYQGCNKNLSFLQVATLHTPIGIIDQGLLRSTDVLSMSMYISTTQE
ncbi:Gem-associated protein 7 [Trichoplax sp. H2]|nr:Gem-associated protein 7 [Trichoplax sp. H2]|eukprot:RDD43667.1 Gem-associated protein 7 [Trichoplax sp. H2]